MRFHWPPPTTILLRRPVPTARLERRSIRFAPFKKESTRSNRFIGNLGGVAIWLDSGPCNNVIEYKNSCGLSVIKVFGRPSFAKPSEDRPSSPDQAELHSPLALLAEKHG